MELKPLFSYRADLDKPIHIGSAAFGVRDILRIKGGEVWGDALSGKLLPAGGEFQLTDADGYFRINVRLVIESSEGIPIYMHYTGVADMPPAFKAEVYRKGYSDFGDCYFMTQPRFECGHEKYQWLNNIVTVAEGRVAGASAVEYRVFECVHSLA